MCVCMRTCVCTRVCAWLWRAEVDVGHSQHHHQQQQQHWRQALSLNLGQTNLGRLADLWLQGSICLNTESQISICHMLGFRCTFPCSKPRSSCYHGRHFIYWVTHLSSTPPPLGFFLPTEPYLYSSPLGFLRFLFCFILKNQYFTSFCSLF